MLATICGSCGPYASITIGSVDKSVVLIDIDSKFSGAGALIDVEVVVKDWLDVPEVIRLTAEEMGLGISTIEHTLPATVREVADFEFLAEISIGGALTLTGKYNRISCSYTAVSSFFTQKITIRG